MRQHIGISAYLKVLVIISFINLAGCAWFNKPQSQALLLPVVSNQLLMPCMPLATIKDKHIKTLVDTVLSNYEIYYKCSANNDAWIQWYLTNKNYLKAKN